MGRPSSFPGPKLRLLLALLLLLAPPVPIQARQLGARRGGGGGSSRDRHVVAGLPLIRMLPEPSEDDDDAGVPPKLITRDALTPAVSRPGGLAPPAPKPSHGPHPLHEHEAPSSQAGGDGLASSSPGVSGRQEQAPPAPQGNPPPHYRRPGPAAYVPRVVWDALARFLDWIIAA